MFLILLNIYIYSNVMMNKEIWEHNLIWYKNTYQKLLDKCRQMKINGLLENVYTEIHHIIPKCMGGTNDKDNLIDLPVRYHIVAHLLLIKIYQEEKGLLHAANMMLNVSNNGLRSEAQSRISTRTYAEVRERYSNSLKGKTLPESTRKKMSISRTGLKRTPEQRKRMSEAQSKRRPFLLGRSLKKETRDRMREAQLGEKNHFYGKNHSKESLKRISFTKTHSVKAPDGTIYKTLGEAAKANTISRDKLSSWLYSENTHGFEWVDKIK